MQIMGNPDLLVQDRTLATRSAGWYWHRRHINDSADRLDMSSS